MLLTELSRSVWENLDRGRCEYRTNAVRSGCMTEVKTPLLSGCEKPEIGALFKLFTSESSAQTPFTLFSDEGLKLSRLSPD